MVIDNLYVLFERFDDRIFCKYSEKVFVWGYLVDLGVERVDSFDFI